MDSKPILYYSKYCDFCSAILQYISHSKIKKDIFFVNIDNRYENNGEILIRFDNNNTIPLPDIIKSVPSLLVIGVPPEVIVGDDIKDFIFDKCKEYDQVATQNQGEPESFSFLGGLCDFVMSDSFSFWDQDADELSAKGNGGSRQMYNYAPIDFMETISTPDEDYISDKMKNISLDKLMSERDKDLQAPVM